MQAPCSVVVLISGSGSNLQALIDGQQDGSLDIAIKAVISNQVGVYGLSRAEKAGIPSLALNHKDFASREAFDQAMQEVIDQYQPDLVVLAGFMRILTGDFVRHYQGRLLNIHPSLLPKYQGLHTHRRALEAGDHTHGVTVHFVTEELDGGPEIIQALVPVLPEDDEQSLSQRVQVQEHIIYPMAVSWFAKQRLTMNNDQVFLDGEALPANGYQVDARET